MSLPKYWAVWRTNSEEFRNHVIAYIRKHDTSCAIWEGATQGYYGYASGTSGYSRWGGKDLVPKECTILTTQEFIELTCSPVLDDWVVKNDNSKDFFTHVIPYINQHNTNDKKYLGTDIHHYYGLVHRRGVATISVPDDATLLTIQQFINLTTNKTENAQKSPNISISGINVRHITPAVTRGPEFTGTAASGRGRKAAVAVGHLSNKASTGRSGEEIQHGSKDLPF